VRSRDSRWLTYLLLLLLWALLVLGGRFLSFTMDEPSHIARGYTYLSRWREGFWYFTPRSHPPLINSAEALLLVLTQPAVSLEALPGWNADFATYTTAFLPHLVPLERSELLSRIPVMALTVLLGALIARWGKELGGPWAGFLALALMTFHPNMLGHGRLATTDAGVTVIGTAALYAAWRWLQRPSWKWTAVVGGLLGLTLLSKLSGAIWSIAFSGMALVAVLVEGRRDIRRGGLRVVQAMVVAALAAFILWVAYGFTFGQTPIFPFPVPAPYYWTAFSNQAGTASRRIFVAFSQVWVGRQWWYFPLNFLLKTPVPLLIVLPLALWVFVRRNLARPRRLLLLLFPTCYIAIAAVKGLNVGFRHMLPVHPFIWLVTAAGVGAAFRRHTWPRGFRPVLALLGVWYVLGALFIFPDELTYFNELAGGPRRGHHYLVDYTHDWGQSYKQLSAYLIAHPGPKPHISTHTRAHPGFYGISYTPLDAPDWHLAPLRPLPGRYVLGVGRLYGLFGDDSMAVEWFRRTTPTAIVGHALRVYDVMDDPTWLAQCVEPVPPLDAAAVDEGLGRPDLRQTAFDCTRAWLYPAEGMELGIYALHHQLLEGLVPDLPFRAERDPIPADPFVARHLLGARLSYEQPVYAFTPAFALYEWPGALPGLPPQVATYAAPADVAPPGLGGLPSVLSPVSMDGPLEFIGAATYSESGGLEIETWWRVTQGPIERPFSIMAHLLTGQGAAVGVADDLGVFPVVLEEGDVVVQRHRFSPVAGREALWLRTGAYWLDTDPPQRWSVAETPGADALLVPLGEE